MLLGPKHCHILGPHHLGPGCIIRNHKSTRQSYNGPNRKPQTANRKTLRGFLGLAGYYRRFVKHYGLSRPERGLSEPIMPSIVVGGLPVAEMNEPNSVVGGLPVAEMNEPNSVVGGLPVVAEMKEPNAVFGGLPVVAEMKEPNAVVGGLPVAAEMKEPNAVVGGLPVAAEMNEPNSVVGGLPVAEMNEPNSVVGGSRSRSRKLEIKIKDPTFKELRRTFKELENVMNPIIARRVTESRWSELPSDLVKLILMKLDVVYILRFKAVCRSWRSAVKSFARCPENPWLFLHTNYRSSIFDPAEKKTYKLRSVYEDFDGACCMGSSSGWIIIESNDSLAHLFNPLTRARFQIPGIQSLPSFSSRASILKVIVSSNPSTTHHSIVVVAYNKGLLAFCKLGDKTWEKLEENMLQTGCGDIMFHDNQLFALALDESLEVWEYKGSIFVKKEYLQSSSSSSPILDYPYYRVTRLVESSGAVLRLRKSGQYENSITPSFTVEKLNEDRKWVQVHKLGYQILFLFGKNDQLMSLSNPCFLECEDNSICFTLGGERIYAHSLTHNAVSRRQILPIPLEQLRLCNEDTAVWLIPNF